MVELFSKKKRELKLVNILFHKFSETSFEMENNRVKYTITTKLVL
jgi:hypothetical protein